MSQEWSSQQSTSKRAHPTPKLILSLSPLKPQATSEEHSNIGNVGVAGADLQSASDGDMTTPRLSTHATGDPDLYYPPSFPPLYLSMYTGRQTTDLITSESQSRDRHTQYATLRLPVSHCPSSLALPSPDFPSSVGSVVGSVPPTATTAEFPPSTDDLDTPSHYYGTHLHPDSDLSLAGASKFRVRPRAHIISLGRQSTPVESTFLSSDSGTDMNSGSQLDPVRVAGPPSGGEVEPLRIHRQQPPFLRPPRSPVYEGSEAQTPPISPESVQTSRPYNTTDPFRDLNDNAAVFIDYQEESKSSEGRPFSLLLPTKPPADNTSPLRHSFQTHATAGSTAYEHDGSSLPSTPICRNSAVPFPDQLPWAEVMQCIKTGDSKAYAHEANGDRLSVEALLSTRDNSSSNASQSNLSNPQGRSNSSLVPPLVARGSTSDGLLTSTSITSGSDSFTTFELMSFPKPPTTVPEQQRPAGPTTRSPWVKGLTLPMPINTTIPKRSIREPGTPTALSAASPSTPFTPPTAPGLNPTFHVVQSPSRVVATTYNTSVPTVDSPDGSQSLWIDSTPPSPASCATSPPPRRNSHLSASAARSSVDGSIYTSSVAPSYNRRISALIHAAEQLTWASRDLASEMDTQARMSKDSDQLGALDRRSEEEPAAVVGVVRIASVSCRSKALLTRAPSSSALATPPATRIQHTAVSEAYSPSKATENPLKLYTEDSALRQGVHTYLSKAPSPSFPASIATPSSSNSSPLKSSPFQRRKSPAHESGFFPDIVVEVDNRFALAHGVDGTGRGDVRGVGIQMDRGRKDETRLDAPFYNEKVLPRVPYPESRESRRPLPPLLPSPPRSPPPLPPTAQLPVILSHARVQSQPDHLSGQLRRQESFGSNTLTRVSSLLSRLSNSTLISTPTSPSRQSTRRCKRGTIIPPPLPPPPLPLPSTPSQMQPTGLGPHPDEGTAGHELMERAGALNRMAQGCRHQKPLPMPDPLDEIHQVHQLMLQQQNRISNGKGYVHKNALSKASSIRSMFSNRSDRSRHRNPNPVILGINAPMSGDSRRFTELDDDEKRKRHWQVRAPSVDPHEPREAGPDLDVRGRNVREPSPNRKKETSRSRWIAMSLLSFAVIGLVVGLVIILARRNPDNQASSSSPSCAESNATGLFCDIGKTCVCTPSVSGRCNPVAQAIADLVPKMNNIFSVNFTTSNVSLTLWDLLGDPLNDCSKQALLIDVAPGLAATLSPNRTEFSRAAILYSLMETESLDTTAQMRSFIANANFSKLVSQDGPVEDDGAAVGLTFGTDGFLYNFASMTLRPPSISWKDNSQATGDQISRVGSIVDSVLDRMYSFSTASSTQRSTALQRYWTSVLQLPSNELSTFLSALRDAPIVLPFDATSESVSNLMSSSTTTSFPPPAACYPGLSGANRTDIDIVETTAFGLPSSTPITSAIFDVGCFTSRPTYGILNVLNLRLPFADRRQGLTIQASQLATAVGPRAVLKAGEQLVGLARASAPSARPNSPISVSNADPRQYGTLLHLNHVALAYLQSFPSTKLAADTAQFIMSTSQLPPNNNSSLFLDTRSLLDIPLIEVSIFGQLLPTDMDLWNSGFAGPQGELFFGTQRGDVFRNWTLRGSDDTILWSTGALTRTAVREVKERSSAFEDVWQATLNATRTTPESVAVALNRAGLFGS